MQTKTSFTVLAFLCSLCIIHRCESSSPNNPTKQFYEDIKTRPILTYQCYQSGNSIDAPGTIDFTILWDGTNPNSAVAHGTTWSAKEGTPNSYTLGSLTTVYDAARGVGQLNTSSVLEDLTVEKPFEGKALYLKIDVTTQGNTVVHKLYDVDYKCENAKKLLKEVCPDPCNWKLSRELH